MGELTTYRPFIESCIESVGGADPSAMFSRCIAGYAQCWAMLAVANGQTVPVAICITKLLDDAQQRRRVLFVDMMTGISGVEQGGWQYGNAVLERWAKMNGCTRSEMLIENPVLLDRVSDMGYRRVGVLVAKEL